MRLQNGLGYAETFELNAAYGSQQSSTYALTAVQPRWIGAASTAQENPPLRALVFSYPAHPARPPAGLDTQLEMRACQTHKSFQARAREPPSLSRPPLRAWKPPQPPLTDRQPPDTPAQQKHSSFTELLRGFSATVVSGPHQAEYELAWRQLAHAAEPGSGFSASKAVRAQAGDSLKSALKYAFSVDRRDSSVVPSEGWAVRLRSELAGLGPDSTFLRFFRQEAEAQVVVPLLRGVALALSTHAGALVPLAGPGGGGAAAAAQQPSLISDRFFLGGPGSLRGFRTKGVGPTDERVPVRGESGAAAADAPLPAKAPRDALGGDVLLSGAAVVTVEMPEALGPLRALGIHAHCFVNAGTLLPLREARAGGLEGLKQSARAACGVGLVFPLVFGRLEANYCRVLRAAEHDRLARWQVGLSSHGL